ncbi:hypothetical protein H112_02608 [Trichophyton rubrum D6]|uniref:Uncharacterized protein n=1 Tax=Trichophyton rubrum CBS 288.86 TaxID=1215330 RepID=A0A022W8H2_TRIRU|nr:hypothetical protein H100_02614 [Trichophyton rubrum MR850]EZF43974.1 hypothetical protein H102_02605 [Trichophyton rubrum CBS 100081]EZF54637.1 hypothetical protein H103_02619 [Trichophyton rubrum CBS 288.86]EZF65213.1 hypothetical protein H104_02596 [Trichophyton rubrum CBS 289.86]EZF86534.1 hypothetical protein H110_02613 [Trichophyton rubrum MR1448]EZG18842.1 hypothetical protein H107_02692 [Trichophyton rubrum CBS 202.88]KDB35749.1 hypothetical protein H112_02608 [Trichophyton rubrum 
MNQVLRLRDRSDRERRLVGKEKHDKTREAKANKSENKEQNREEEDDEEEEEEEGERERERERERASEAGRLLRSSGRSQTSHHRQEDQSGKKEEAEGPEDAGESACRINMSLNAPQPMGAQTSQRPKREGTTI